MSCPFNTEQLSQLKAFVQVCQAMPQLLHHPSLDFFKDFIVSLGGSIPAAPASKPGASPTGDHAPPPEKKPEPAAPSEDSEPESEVELDMEGVIEGDELEEQEMGDPNKISTEEEVEQSNEKRSAAMRLFAEQQFDEAINLYNEAIILNPTSSLLFAKRGQAFLKLNKPNACIKDCTRALEMNCDSAAGYKFRGRAYRLLGQFDKAASDLRESCKIDCDEQAQEWLAEVTPNADKLRAHNLNVQRRQEEKEHREKLKRYEEAKAAHASAASAAQNAPPSSGSPFGDAATGDIPGAGGPFNMADSMGFFNDPELIAAFQDPEVAAAFKDATANPANIFKYQNNPKVANILNKLSSKVGSGGAGGFAGFNPPQPGAGSTPKDSVPTDDVGLD